MLAAWLRALLCAVGWPPNQRLAPMPSAWNSRALGCVFDHELHHLEEGAGGHSPGTQSSKGLQAEGPRGGMDGTVKPACMFSYPVLKYTYLLHSLIQAVHFTLKGSYVLIAQRPGIISRCTPFITAPHSFA